MLLSAMSVLVVAQSSSEIPEGLMNNPVYQFMLNGTYKEPVRNLNCVALKVVTVQFSKLQFQQQLSDKRHYPPCKAAVAHATCYYVSAIN